MSAQPTPGPWQADDVFMERQRATRVAMPDNHGVPGETIAECWVSDADDYEGRCIGVLEAEANARLIAAAPEMLEALKQALLYIEADEISHGRKFGDGNVVRAAIARAEGRSK